MMSYSKQKQPPPNAEIKIIKCCLISGFDVAITGVLDNSFHLHPIIVITAALAAYCHFAPLTPYVLPELKANQPHHSTKSPMHALTGFPVVTKW